MGSAADRARGVRERAQQALAASGLRVEDVTITPAGRRRVVRVVVDTDLAHLDPGDETSPVEPLSLDAVADATRAVSEALDAADALGDSPYVLEVTSPGVGRPLVEPRHFRRNVGRLVELVLTDGSALTGRIVAAGEERIGLEVTGADDVATRREVAWDAISRARVQVEFVRESDREQEQ